MLFKPARKVGFRHRDHYGIGGEFHNGQGLEPGVEALNIDAILDIFEEPVPEHVFFKCGKMIHLDSMGIECLKVCREMTDIIKSDTDRDRER